MLAASTASAPPMRMPSDRCSSVPTPPGAAAPAAGGTSSVQQRLALARALVAAKQAEAEADEEVDGEAY